MGISKLTALYSRQPICFLRICYCFLIIGYVCCYSVCFSDLLRVDGTRLKARCKMIQLKRDIEAEFYKEERILLQGGRMRCALWTADSVRGE